MALADLSEASLAQPTLPSARAEWKQGWSLVAASAFAYGTSYVPLGFVVSYFVTVLNRELGWTRGEVSLAGNAAIVGGLCAPIWGRAVERYGVRPILLVALPPLGLAYALMPQMTEVWQYYLLHAVIAGFGVATTAITYGRVIAGWFVTSRGLALSACGIASTIIGMILPSLLQLAETMFGWRSVFYIMSMLPLAIALPLTVLLVREKPGSCGRSPNGGSPSDQADQEWRRQVRQAIFWRLMIAASLHVGVIMGVLSQLQPLLVDTGIGAAAAAGLMGLMGAATFAGSLLSGLLVDRLWAPMVAGLAAACGAVGCVLLLAFPAPLGLGVAIVLVGISFGTAIQVVTYLVARYFGTATFPTLMGIYTLGSALGGALGMTMTGLIYDGFGTYSPAMTLTIAALLLCTGLYLTLGGYPELHAGSAQDSGTNLSRGETL